MSPRPKAIAAPAAVGRVVRARVVRARVVLGVLVVVLAALAAPARAGAEPGRLRGARLTWARAQGAEACVGPLGLEESVKKLLGGDPFVLPPELAIEGVFVREARGLRADVWLRDRDGRTLGRRTVRSSAADCAELGRATATIVAVMIDPDHDGPREAKVDEPSPDTAPPAPAAPPADLRETLDDAELPSLQAALTVGATAGLVPGPSDVYALRADLAVHRLVSVGLGASWFRPTRAGGRDGDFAFGLTTAEARACLTPWGPRGALRVCGALLVGAFDASLRRTTLRPLEVGVFPWLGAELGPSVALPLDRAGAVAITAGVSAFVPILRRQGLVGGSAEPVWEQSPVGGRAELGLTFRP